VKANAAEERARAITAGDPFLTAPSRKQPKMPRPEKRMIKVPAMRPPTVCEINKKINEFGGLQVDPNPAHVCSCALCSVRVCEVLQISRDQMPRPEKGMIKVPAMRPPTVCKKRRSVLRLCGV